MYTTSRYYSLYGQDSWRARQNLILNYGLRWEVTTPWYEKHNQIETIVRGLQSVVFPGAPKGGVFPGDPGIARTLAPTRYKNFGPRVGMAYSPKGDGGISHFLFGSSGNSSIRAGYGLFYTAFEVIPTGRVHRDLAPLQIVNRRSEQEVSEVASRF